MGKSWKKAGKLEAAQKKGAIFTKLAREIAVAARMGGGDPMANSRLKLAIDEARQHSCPKDTIERAIKKGTGQLGENAQIDEITYEGFGPHGVGILVETQTDNRNRTVSELRNLFKTHGGNLGETGAVGWMFERVALIRALKEGPFDPEEEAIEAGANEVERDEAEFHFYAGPADLDEVRLNLGKRGWTIAAAELSYRAKELAKLDDAAKGEVSELMEALDDFEDSHRVHATY